MHGSVPELTLITVVGIVAIGGVIGFLGGLLGKGGSAIATPALVALGLPPIVALAAPLPATVPGAMVAANRYREHGHIDRTVLRWSLIAGVPATILGAFATRWIDAGSLVLLTDLVIIVIGLRMLRTSTAKQSDNDVDEGADRNRTIAVALVTGVAAGLLANSGGFLLAPLFVAVLGLGIRPALGTSLATASVLAIPGTMVHMAMGHLDLAVVVLFAIGSIPLSGLGARVALRADVARLERFYGASLVVLGAVFLAISAV